MTPALPVPLSVRRHTILPVSKIILFFVTYLVAFSYGTVSRAMCDVLLVLAFLSTFTAPGTSLRNLDSICYVNNLAALIHIVVHNFRRPLAIVMPATPAVPSHPSLNRSESYNDELLQRKERTLQRRRFARRILWDIGVWTLLVPVSGGALVWSVGRLAGRW